MSTEREDADTIEDVAANWLAEREDGLSSARAREFEAWCRADPQHAAAVARLEQACALLQKMPQVRAELQPVVEFPVTGRAPAPRAGATRRWTRVQLAAAAAAILVAVAIPVWPWLGAGPDSARHATSAGGYERVRLADGSTLELNASSEAQVRFTAQERRVALLAGEAHFTVAPDAARPFFVEAGGVAVRAVGTAFNVRLAPEAVEVLVTEGKVTVARLEQASPGARPEAAGSDPARPTPRPLPATTTLVARERLVIPTLAAGRPPEAGARSGIETVAPDAIRVAMAWQERKLVFAETPLREVAAQFNRRNRLQVVVADPELAERPVGGTFAADNVDAFIRLLEGSGTIAVERRDDTTVVLRAAP
jgi:transmembrane sensor